MQGHGLLPRGIHLDLTQDDIKVAHEGRGRDKGRGGEGGYKGGTMGEGRTR